MGKMDLLNFYKGKKVLITGASGFKGSWLSLILHYFGAEVMGYSLKPNTNPSMFRELKIDTLIQNTYADILDTEKLENVFSSFKPEILFHLAAQPLVRLSYAEPVLTYKTNVIGTLNVLEVARKCDSVTTFINITTDKCYENIEKDVAYKETDPMGGYDMYSSSKGCAEILSASYRNSFLQKEHYGLATARAGNVIGGGDWALDRLIPDCIRSINNTTPIQIRNPTAIRPWQHVLEPLSGYLELGRLLYNNKNEFSQSYNFGPKQDDILNVESVVNEIIKYYKDGIAEFSNSDNLHEATLLMLDITKAKEKLNWFPKYSAVQAIQKTVSWYKTFYEKKQNMIDFTNKQIYDFFEDN